MSNLNVFVVLLFYMEGFKPQTLGEEKTEQNAKRQKCRWRLL